MDSADLNVVFVSDGLEFSHILAQVGQLDVH